MPTVDCHTHLFFAPCIFGYDLRKRHRPLPIVPSFQTDLPRLKKSGLDILFAYIYPISEFVLPLTRIPERVAIIETKRYFRLIEHTDTFKVLKEPDEICKGDIGVVIGIECAHALGGDVSNIEIFFKRGLRVLCLAHFFPNSAVSKRLTGFGRECISECERLGIIIDTAHMPPGALEDTLELARKPVINSHTGLARLRKFGTMNIKDEHVKAIAQKGGTIGIILFPPMLSYFPVCTIDRVIDHIERVIEIAGEDHVSIGSDLDGIPWLPIGMRDVENYQILREAMLKRGFHKGTIQKVMGENILRVWREVRAGEVR